MAAGQESAAARMRELEQLMKAVESEISMGLTYIQSPDDARRKKEIARERHKIALAEARIAHLESYSEESVQKWRERREEIKQLLIVTRNEAQIEKLIRMQLELNDITADMKRPAVAAFSQDAYEPDDDDDELEEDGDA